MPNLRIPQTNLIRIEINIYISLPALTKTWESVPPEAKRYTSRLSSLGRRGWMSTLNTGSRLCHDISGIMHFMLMNLNLLDVLRMEQCILFQRTYYLIIEYIYLFSRPHSAQQTTTNIKFTTLFCLFREYAKENWRKGAKKA